MPVRGGSKPADPNGLTTASPMTRIRITSLLGFDMKRVACLLLFVALSTFAGFADDDKDKGHQHHEDLTETQLGTVHFPVSCAPSVQEPFARGVALLHSFWYEEAEKEFLNITHTDSRCAMAHWGIAMSLWHQLWNEPDANVIKRGLGEAMDAKTLASDADSAKSDLTKSSPREKGPTLRPWLLSTATRKNSTMTPAPKLIPTR